MDLFHILIIFPLKILDVTNGVPYHFLSNPYALKRLWDVILSLGIFKHGKYIDWINLSVYWVTIRTKTSAEGTRGALSLFIK